MGPLHGVKILDMSVMISGPLAAMTLAEQGAEVVKVESPGLGDLMRFLGTSKGGMTGIFAGNNRGKRSLVVDVKKPEGLDVVRKLAAQSDVLIQNFRPGAMDRLGLGWEDMHAINPRLIYVSISGFGPDGPKSDQRVYDNVIQASSGLASVQADSATGVPALFRTLLCDKVTSLTAAQAITAALFARERGAAAGQHIVLAMLDAAISFLWPDSAMDAMLLDDDVQRSRTIGSAYAVTEFADGYAAVSAVSDSEWHGYFRSLGRPDLCEDERYATMAARMQHLGELVPLLRELAKVVPLERFLAAAAEHQVPTAPIVSLDELPLDAQVVHNDVFTIRQHPVAGTIRDPRPAPRFSATPAATGHHAPTYGQHSDEIVAELGLDALALRAAGVII
jgi:crotonobetainyl-CoA:carnitine CoA-transferase CaiB-like acyl-CoA transferase